MLNKFTVLALLTVSALSKLDYGACPNGVQQVPFSADLSGTYYLQYYDEFLDYIQPILSNLRGIKTFECYSQEVNRRQETYNSADLPLEQRIFRLDYVYQDPTKNAGVFYICFDSRIFVNVLALGMEVPAWALQYWNKFIEIFQIWHMKLMVVGSKTTSIDDAVKNDVANFVNTFPHKRAFPYNFAKDFK